MWGNAVDAHRPGDVLERLGADIGKLGVDFAAHLPKRVLREADAAGLGNAFEPRCDVDPVAQDVVALDQHIAEMDADAPFHAPVAGDRRIALHPSLCSATAQSTALTTEA